MADLSTWVWLFAAVAGLVLVERWVHRRLQAVWLLLLRSADAAMVLYAITMLPGVLLHEASHWLVATLVGARTGRFSVIPERLPNGSLRLGYVETEQTDVVREALIGTAPLAIGSAAVLAIGYGPLRVGPAAGALTTGDLGSALLGLWASLQAPDAWLWLYLLFAVSNSMLPSPSDRRAWLPLAIFGAACVAGLAYAGLGVIFWRAVSGPIQAGAQFLAAAFTITIGLDLGVAPALWLAERALGALTGLKVEY